MPDQTAFEEHLDKSLQAYLDPYAVGSIPVWRMPAQGRARVKLLGGAGAALTAKIAVGAVIAVMAAGATTEAVITRSVNPVDWARQVTQQVQPAQKPAASSPAAAAAQSPQAVPTAAVTPVVSAPALPTVSAPAVPTPKLPLPTPTPLPSLP